MNNMKNLRFGLLIGIVSVFLFSCKNSSNSTIEEQEGIQIDPELKELGELNLILLKYDEVDNKVGDYLSVRSNKKWGVINIKGDTIVKFEYDNIRAIEDKYWHLFSESKSGKKRSVEIVDIKGNLVISPIECKDIEFLGDGLFVTKVDKGDFITIFNEKGEEVGVTDYEFDYDISLFDIEKLKDGIFMIENSNENWYRMSYDNGECSLDSICYYGVVCGDDICYVKNEEGKWGAIDTKGNLIVPYTYSNAAKYSDNVFVQNEEGKWGVDRGEFKSDFYEGHGSALDNYYLLWEGNTKIIIDKQCKEILRTEDQISFTSYYQNGMFITNSHLYNGKGNIIATVNDSLRILQYFNKFMVVDSNGTRGLHGVVDDSGKIVVPLDSISLSVKGEKSMVFTRVIKDEVVNGKREVDLKSEIFDTEKREYFKTNFYIHGKADGHLIAKIENKDILITEEGKTGFLNIDNVIEGIKAEKERNKQNGQKELEENIKKQLCEMINEENGRVLKGPGDIKNLEKVSEGNYKARFYIYGEYEDFTYDILNIKVDEDGTVQDFKVQLFRITPTDKKPDGTADPNEIVRRRIQGLQY